MEWSNDGEILAVCGFVRLPNLECCNCLMLYSNSGNLRYSLPIPVQVSQQQALPLICVLWSSVLKFADSSIIDDFHTSLM